jgi:hypothetical protein
VTRHITALGAGFRPVRALFIESHMGNSTWWHCRLCSYAYTETEQSPDWPVSLQGLLLLVKHVRGHQSG